MHERQDSLAIVFQSLVPRQNRTAAESVTASILEGSLDVKMDAMSRFLNSCWSRGDLLRENLALRHRSSYLRSSTTSVVLGVPTRF